MRTPSALVYGLLLAVLSGCSKSPLQGSGSVDAARDRSDDPGTTDGEAPQDARADAAAPPDATAGADATADADATVGQDAPPDAATDAGLDGDGPPVVVPRSFVVTSAVKTDGGLIAVGTFTMVLAADQRSAIVGAGGSGSVVSVVPAAAGALRISGSLGFGVPSGSCSSSGYSDLTFSIDANGQLSGTGQMSVITTHEDGVSSTTATVSVSGVPDRQPPTFSLSTDRPDPFVSFWVTTSEPLPPTARPVLRSSGGDEIALSPAPSSTLSTFVSKFEGPAAPLRFDETYRIILGGIQDFAGNTAPASADFALPAIPAPPLVPEDGFESATGTTLGGAQLLSGTTAPTITGARSLYIPAAPSTLGPRLSWTQLALRLALAPGDTVVRFNYRTVNPSGSSNAGFEFGSVGGTLGGGVLPPDTGTQTTAMLLGGQVMLGPVMTAEFPLPAGAAAELVLARTTSSITTCGGYAPAIAGLIIDDLRAE